MQDPDMKYLRLLARQFPNIAAASAEIINLRAILSLPKGSEHFLSDLHGEYEAFSHVLRNASGIVKERLHALFGYALTEAERRKLATLIYYPQEKLGMQGEPAEGWLEKHLYLLVQVARSFAAQYTRSKTRKAMPPAFAYIMEELLLEKEELPSKQAYYRSIIQSIIEIDRGPAFIVALSEFIQRLAVDRLHIIGDVYDRGPGAEKIMDDLLRYHSVDFQWGNHDIVWMGAAAGSWACMANVLRVSLRYNNTDTLEDGYGISLLPLATFALEHYADDDNRKFRPKDVPEGHFAEKDMALKQRMHKAISIIQFKLEEQLVSRRPSFGMAHRLLLHTLRPAEGIVTVEGREYALTDTHFPTFLPHDPCALTPEEAEVMRRIAASFQYSEKLQRHVRFLYEQGSMYLTRNSNLLLHGCVPMADDGGFLDFDDQGTLYAGKALVDRFEVLAREGFFGKKGSAARLYAEDVLWYLWCGSRSPIFGKERMATFERYFIADPAAHAEPKNAYYRLRNSAEHCGRILEAFGLNPVEGRILNGHVPVVVKKGEKPIKADGRLVVIDGGFAKAYQSETGIAGYTLIDDAFGLRLVAHEPFESRERAISAEQDILASETVVLAQTPSMRRIADTDKGLRLERQIEDLKALLQAYRKGVIQERELPGE